MNKITNEALKIPAIQIGGQDPANFQLPDPDLLMYYSDLDKRWIFIEGELDEITLSYQQQILLWNTEDDGIPVEERKPIKVFIDSPGGYLSNAMSLAKTIELSKTPVYTYNLCEACSGAFLILISGDEGHRYAMPFSTSLYHRGSGQIAGEFDNVASAQSSYKAQIKAMQKFVASRTKISEATLAKKRSVDWYMDTDEQIANGVVDEIITDMNQLIK